MVDSCSGYNLSIAVPNKKSVEKEKKGLFSVENRDRGMELLANITQLEGFLDRNQI